ncbi:hypothetical protein N136_00904 [Leifsonia aquatica ATCC 14665]|uniref:Uncharacterized protein n=1 Tax=Leifsonia aquatica ATCC 14665 TaxID=1358026 RepID=U2RBX4_LEIAQ|nr:hypothetical protein N136_00904 [Leifsonia aquatica ATCC 14665]
MCRSSPSTGYPSAEVQWSGRRRCKRRLANCPDSASEKRAWCAGPLPSGRISRSRQGPS